MKYIDLHTHQPTANPEVLFVYNLRAGSQRPADLRGPYSYGLHPWDSIQRELIELIIQLKTDNQLFFIGECGLDKFRGAALTAQKQILEIQLRKAEELKRPVLLHCVGCHNELLQMKQAFHPQQYWVLHGFRGHPRLAEQLLKAGFLFSFGTALFEKGGKAGQSLQILPQGSWFLESDDSALPIQEIYRQAAALLHCKEAELKSRLYQNFMLKFAPSK